MNPDGNVLFMQTVGRCARHPTELTPGLLFAEKLHAGETDMFSGHLPPSFQRPATFGFSLAVTDLRTQTYVGET